MSPALKLQAPARRAARRPRPTTTRSIEPQLREAQGQAAAVLGLRRRGPRRASRRCSTWPARRPPTWPRFFRRAAPRSAARTGAAGRPVWPSPADARMVPDSASLVGEHAFSGAACPRASASRSPAAQDLMPPLQVQQAEQGGATELRWAALPTARAYFVAGMGAARQDEMVIWTSSELPDIGFGLIDYQTNAAVDRWLNEKVLLAPATTHCTRAQGRVPGRRRDAARDRLRQRAEPGAPAAARPTRRRRGSRCGPPRCASSRWPA